MSDSYWVYILLCNNNSYYTGFTSDLNERYKLHLEGKGAKYTRSFKPISIAQSWEINFDKAAAMKVERHIKKLSRAEKCQLIANPNMLNIGQVIGLTDS